MRSGGRFTMIRINTSLLVAGYCRHLEGITLRGGAWRSCEFPALCALLQHPEYGYLLFDTGYTPRFFSETRGWPFSLYRQITPVHISPDETVVSQLAARNIAAEQIQTIMLSHFHADHIGGVKDFPQARIFSSKTGFSAIRGLKGLRALRRGFLAKLLPEDMQTRVSYIEDQPSITLDAEFSPFTVGFDLYNDGSLIAIHLPGHAEGQFGLLFYDQQGMATFLVADSCWSSLAFREYRLPHFLTYVIHHHRKAYQDTLFKLHTLYRRNPHIRIIPSHCGEIAHNLEREK